MDIAQLNPAARWIDITNPATHKPTGLRIQLRPMSHAAIQKVQRSHTDKMARQRKFRLTAAEIEAHSLDVLVASIEAWEWGGDASFNGEKPDLTPENARLVLAVAWIKEQIDSELGDSEAFFTT